MQDAALAGLLSCTFVVLGLAQLFELDPITEQFVLWGYVPWVMPLVGFAEFVGGLMLLHRRFAVFGAAMLGVIMVGVIMVGVIATHLVDGKVLVALLPTTLCASLFVLAARAHRPESFRQAHSVSYDEPQTHSS